MSYELAPLPYSMDALEPYLDTKTMEIHYGKHHQAYLNNLNAAVEKHPDLFKLSIEQLLSNIKQVPEDIRTAVRNHGGGYYHHTIYWKMMTPKSSREPLGKLLDAINGTFGNFNTFKQDFEKIATGHFGSGWAWLSKKSDGSLLIHSTPNQDSPLLEGLYPIIGVDVWEHAYYLKYQNRRIEFVQSWWNVINWENAEERYSFGKVS